MDYFYTLYNENDENDETNKTNETNETNENKDLLILKLKTENIELKKIIDKLLKILESKSNNLNEYKEKINNLKKI